MRRATSLASVGIVLTMMSLNAVAADWEFEPAIQVSETYRTNVNLGPSDDENDEWITEIAPGFMLSLDGANNTASLEYQMQALLFANDSDQNDVYHELKANGEFQIAEDRLFLDTDAAYRQENINPAGRVALDNSSDTDNRTDVGIFSISPWWQQPIGNFADSVVRYTFGLVEYFNSDNNGDTETETNNSHSNDVTWTLSDARQSQLGWQTNYEYRRVDFDDDSTEFEYQKGELQLTFAVSSKTRLVATGGRESDIQEDPSKGSLDSTFYNGGFSWNPNQRQSLEALVGHRYYGTSYELHWKRQGSRGEVSVDYTEEATTSNGAQFDDSVFQQDGQRLGVPRLDDRVYVRKRWAAGLVYDFVRTQIKLDGYRDKRDYEVDTEDDSRSDETFWGLRSRATWNALPRTDLILQADWERQELDEADGGGTNDLTYFTLEVRRTLRPGMTLGLIAGRYNRDSDNNFDYTDNSATLRFDTAF